jgi:glycerol-3-phosphate acyltransferase PlsY
MIESIEQSQFANWFRPTGCALAAYLLGCFATGYYLVRARIGKDIREIQSGGVGACNVGRVLGKSGFIVTLFCDSGKGALAVWLVLKWTNDGPLALLAMLAVVVGHIWPIQLRFRGGKGVAVSLGASLVFDYRIVLTLSVLFLAGFVLTRKAFFPGMIAFACLPLAGWFFKYDNFTLTLLAGLSAAILIAHHKNLVDEFAALSARHSGVPKPE